MRKTTIVSLIFGFFCVGCSIAPKDAEAIKGLDIVSKNTIEQLSKQHHNLKTELETAVGHIVIDMKVTKVPVVGAGGGQGVIYTKGSEEKVYIKAVRADVGGGWGARSYKVLVVIHSSEVLEKSKKNHWIFDAGAEVAAGSAALEGGTGSLSKGYNVYHLSDIGASATITARAIRVTTTPVR